MENNNIEATAKLSNFRGSARKARLVLDMIRGKDVIQARNILQFSAKRMAKDIHKLLNSAIANANQKAGKVDINSLQIQKCWADEGMTMKRTMPRAQGRAMMIKKRTCHINLTVGEKV